MELKLLSYLRFFATLAIVCVCMPYQVAAASYALLVGVSDYEEASGAADLRGPANDVRLLRDVLSERADFSITMLADGVEGATRPTRAAILSELDRLAAQVVDGDFVYLHFSGHGTQQADQNGDESDGLDEVFLPADTARAEPGSATIPNAIVDEEFGARVTAMRAKGADVWFVLDACHSGSGLRAGSPRVATRFVDPAALGITIEPKPQPAATASLDAMGEDDLPGSYLAFYSAQSSELAREIQIDEALPDSWYGLFTSRLAGRLQSEAAISYRQLFQAVLTDLNDEAIPGDARLQTPLWEGDLIDAPVFGGGDVVGVRQFAVEGGQVKAGKLQGVIDNTVVALVAEASAAADDILGYAQVQQTDATTGRLNAVAAACVPSVDGPCATNGAISQDARFARIVAKPLDQRTLIAPPYDLASGAALPEAHPLYVALAASVAATNAEHGTNIALDPSGVVLSGASGGALWLGHKLAIGDTPVGLRWSPEIGPLDPLLLRIAKAEQLAGMLSSVAGTPSMLFPSPIEISVEHRIADSSRLSPTTPGDIFAECQAATATADVANSLSSGTALKQCDALAFGAKGLVQGPARDVNAVYIDNQFCASAEYQRVEGVSVPAIVGSPFTICSECPGSDGLKLSAGVERMFFVVTEAAANSEALNLEGLVATCQAPGAPTRSTNNTQVESFLGGLAQQNATRSRMGAIGLSNIWVEQFNWQVLPRREARQQAGLVFEN